MSLKEDLETAWEENTDRYWTPVDVAAELEGVEVLSDEVFDTSPRWEEIWKTVARRGDEYVEIMYRVGSTEMQEPEYNPEFYNVEPYEVTVTKYRRV